VHKTCICRTLITTETQRAQSQNLFARSGDGDRAKEASAPSPQWLWRVGDTQSISCETTFVPRRWTCTRKSFRRRRRLFSLAVVSRPGKNHPPLCPLCLCGESSIRSPQAVIMRSKVTNRFRYWEFGFAQIPYFRLLRF